MGTFKIDLPSVNFHENNEISNEISSKSNDFHRNLPKNTSILEGPINLYRIATNGTHARCGAPQQMCARGAREKNFQEFS